MKHRARQPARLTWAAGFVVLALLGGFLAYRDAVRVSDDDLARSTVKLTVYLRGGKVGTGSGTIVDADRGLILTNAHVVAPRAAGLAVNSATLPDAVQPVVRRIVVSVSPGAGDTARPRFRASVVAADGYLDLAVVKITRTTSGAGTLADSLDDLTQLEPARAAADPRPGDGVRVIGYPGDTRSHPSGTTRGDVSGATPDPRLRTRRAYVNTDSRADAGAGGGPAVDDAGRIIGVPTLGRTAAVAAGTKQTSDQGAKEKAPVTLRPIGFALPLIAAARAGKPYSSPWTTPAPATAKVSAIRLSSAGEAPVVLGCTKGGQSTGTLSVGLAYNGFGLPADGHTDLMATLYSSTGGRLAPVASAGTLSDYPTTLPAAGCVTLTLAGDDGAPLPAGHYLLRVGLGASLTRIASAGFDLPTPS